MINPHVITAIDAPRERGGSWLERGPADSDGGDEDGNA